MAILEESVEDNTVMEARKEDLNQEEEGLIQAEEAEQRAVFTLESDRDTSTQDEL